MKVQKEKNNIALITSIRLLLWWGAEAAETVFLYRKPVAQEQKIVQSDRAFPLSSWGVVSQKVYCLVSVQNDRKVTIHPSGDISTN